MLKLLVMKLNHAQISYDNPLSANITKWSNTLTQFVGKLPTNCLSVFDNFVGLVLKGIKAMDKPNYRYVQNKHGFGN